MLILTEQEDKEKFSDFMTRLSVSIYKNSESSVQELLKAHPNLNAVEHVEEIGLAVGQIAYDKTIELVETMDKDFIIKLLAQIAASMAVDSMNKDPHFRHLVVLASKLM